MEASVEVSPTVVKAVAKELKKYMQTGRRENGFDDSRLGQVGAFSSAKGGSLYYCALQDKHLKHYLEKPSTKKHLFATGTIPEHLLSPVERRAQARLLRSDLRGSAGEDRITHTVAELLASGAWKATQSSSRRKERQLETPLWSPGSTSCGSSPSHHSRSHSSSSSTTILRSDTHNSDGLKLKDEGREGSSSSIADVLATASQESLCASRPCSVTDGSRVVERHSTPMQPPAHSERAKCSQGTQTVEDKVVQVDVVSTLDCGVHVTGAVEQATQTCPESGVQTDLSYLMQYWCLSCAAEESQGHTSVKQPSDAAVSLHQKGTCCKDDVQGGVEMTQMQQEMRLHGSEQTLERRNHPVVSGASLSAVPVEEGRTVEPQPHAVLSGGEQPVDLIKQDTKGAAVAEEEDNSVKHDQEQSHTEEQTAEKETDSACEIVSADNGGKSGYAPPLE